MDEMKIASGFMQGTLSRIIRKLVLKKLGIEPNLKFEDPISVKFDGEKATVHLNVTASLSKEDLSKLLKDLV